MAARSCMRQERSESIKWVRKVRIVSARRFSIIQFYVSKLACSQMPVRFVGSLATRGRSIFRSVQRQWALWLQLGPMSSISRLVPFSCLAYITITSSGGLGSRGLDYAFFSPFSLLLNLRIRKCLADISNSCRK